MERKNHFTTPHKYPDVEEIFPPVSRPKAGNGYTVFSELNPNPRQLSPNAH